MPDGSEIAFEGAILDLDKKINVSMGEILCRCSTEGELYLTPLSDTLPFCSFAGDRHGQSGAS